MSNIKNLVQDVVASPLGDVIAEVGRGVAEAQHALDEGSLGAVLDIYAESDDEKLRLLQEIGYRPTFYALPETSGEVRVALRMGQGASGARNATPVKPTLPSVRAVPARVGLNTASRRLYSTPVDARYANQFGFTADISAKLTFKIVPVPAPDGADELRLVPDLDTRKPSNVIEVLDRLALEPEFRDADGVEITDPAEDLEVSAQDPAPDTIARTGDTVVVTLVASA
ncbi:MAG: hypothetical protein AAGD13_03565 [Pseudomonadota bacterium]